MAGRGDLYSDGIALVGLAKSFGSVPAVCGNDIAIGRGETARGAVFAYRRGGVRP